MGKIGLLFIRSTAVAELSKCISSLQVASSIPKLSAHFVETRNAYVRTRDFSTTDSRQILGGLKAVDAFYRYTGKCALHQVGCNGTIRLVFAVRLQVVRTSDRSSILTP